MTRLERLAEEWAKAEAQHLGINYFADYYERQSWVGISKGAYECGLRAGIEMAAQLVKDEFTHAVTARTPEDAWVTEGRGVVHAIRALLDEPAKEGK